ncbi:MAG: TolC family protein [Candidatus Omnitrophica bacterium]|nr:TolC family protein [Candidatus Omnitrophota bacterium]
MRYVKFLAVISIFLCFTASNVRAEEVLTWMECVKQAKTNHPDLVAAVEKVKQAKATKEVTRSAAMPDINGDASEITSKNASISGAGSSLQNSSGGSSKDANTTYTYGASIQQLLFDGFKTSYDLSADERKIIATKYNYDVVSSNVRLRLRTAFANLLGAQEYLRVTEEIEARRKQSLELVRLKYEAGREHRGSLLTSEADLAQAKFDVDQAKRSIYLAERQLTKEMGSAVFIPAVAKGELKVKEAEREQPDFEKLTETTPFLQQLIAQKEAARFGVRSAKAQFFPQIYFNGDVGNTNVNSFPDKNEWSAGTTLTLPIFDGGYTVATVSKAKATLGQAEADERSGRDSVVLTLSDTWIKLQDAVDKVEVQRKFMEAAKERARISDAEYSIGLSIYDNWIIIENNLVSAEKALVTAERDAMIAEANWIQAKGGTLDYDQE